MAAGDSTLRRIKRCALQGRLRFTVKAQLELELDDLTREDVRESLLNAVAIYKTIRSARRGVGREYFHVIQIPNFDGVMNKLKITRCPMCGSRRIHRVRRDLKGSFRGRGYIARGVEFEECPDCGERLYDLNAMAKLESARSASSRRRKRVA